MKENRKRRIEEQETKCLSHMTANPQPGPMKSALPDHRRAFRTCYLPGYAGILFSVGWVGVTEGS